MPKVFIYVMTELAWLVYILTSHVLVTLAGNYCPVCHQCYADDDWDVKMIQCESCDSWVHAKCKQMNGEW